MTERQFAILGLASLLLACQPKPPAAAPPADVTAEIEAAGAAFAAAMNAGDAAGIANVYMMDAQLLPPNAPIITGRAGIEAYWRGMLEASHPRVTLNTLEVQGTDSMAVEVARFILTDSIGAGLDQGKYMAWWQRTPDGWRMHTSIWNSDLPAAGSAPAPGAAK